MPFSNPYLGRLTGLKQRHSRKSPSRNHWSGDAANLWSDVNGITSISGNVFVADENGFFRFYVTAGQYDLEINRTA